MNTSNQEKTFSRNAVVTDPILFKFAFEYFQSKAAVLKNCLL